MSKPKTITVVFKVEGDNTAFYEAFKNNTAICGMRPVTIGTGDQMNVPTEIVEELSKLDEWCQRKDIGDLIVRARDYLKEV